MNGWSRLIFIALGAVALVFGLTEPTTKSTLDPALKEIADLRPDAFMEGVYQRQFDAAGQLETTLVATSLLDFGDRANAELVDPKLWLERPPATWYIEGERGELTEWFYSNFVGEAGWHTLQLLGSEAIIQPPNDFGKTCFRISQELAIIKVHRKKDCHVVHRKSIS